jgi:SAM-dependent methyltransferase
MSELNGRIRDRIAKLFAPFGEDLTIGVVCSPTKQGVQRAIEMIPEMEDGELIFLVLGSKKDIDMDLSMEFQIDVSSFPSKYDDIPLKGSYLDAVISTIHFVDVPDPQKLIREISRTVKPGGQVIIIDYAELDSIILEDIFQHHIDASGSTEYKGEDMEELVSLLEPYVVRAHAERFKELMVLNGKRSKKRKKK